MSTVPNIISRGPDMRDIYFIREAFGFGILIPAESALPGIEYAAAFAIPRTAEVIAQMVDTKPQEQWISPAGWSSGAQGDRQCFIVPLPQHIYTQLAQTPGIEDVPPRLMFKRLYAERGVLMEPARTNPVQRTLGTLDFGIR